MHIFQSLLLQSLVTCTQALSLDAIALASAPHLEPRTQQLTSFDLKKTFRSRLDGYSIFVGGKVGRLRGGSLPVARVNPKPSHSPKTGTDAAAGEKTTSGGKPIIDSINQFRTEKGLPRLGWSPQMAKNAAVTGQATGGRSMVHKMGPGTNGQVLIMGFDDAEGCTRNLGGYTPFELFYYSWLCEMPNDGALKGRCPDVLRRSRIDNRNQLSHYEILTAKRYKTIGCAFTSNSNAQKCGAFSGIWACDLSM